MKPERSQAPLWVVVVGLATALYSRSIRDERIGDIVFLVGLFCAAIAVVYWFFYPKHGMRK